MERKARKANWGRQCQVKLYCPPELISRLDAVSDETHVPLSDLIREGMRRVIAEHESTGRVAFGEAT